MLRHIAAMALFQIDRAENKEIAAALSLSDCWQGLSEVVCGHHSSTRLDVVEREVLRLVAPLDTEFWFIVGEPSEQVPLSGEQVVDLHVEVVCADAVSELLRTGASLH